VFSNDARPDFKVYVKVADRRSVSRRLAILVVVLHWLPLIALAVLSGVILGWRVPVLFAVVIAILTFRSKRPAKEVGYLRSVVEFVSFAALGGVIGGLALGGVATIIGIAVGFIFRLAEVPLTGGRSFPLRRGNRP
jgi:hypothetical protein